MQCTDRYAAFEKFARVLQLYISMRTGVKKSQNGIQYDSTTVINGNPKYEGFGHDMHHLDMHLDMHT